MKKITPLRPIDQAYLDNLKPAYEKKGYNVPQWIRFCEAMLGLGLSVSLYRAKTTVSKYVHVAFPSGNVKVRFSNHRANKAKENLNDADYYVGVGNKYVLTTDELIQILTDKLSEERTNG